MPLCRVITHIRMFNHGARMASKVKGFGQDLSISQGRFVMKVLGHMHTRSPNTFVVS